MLGAVVEADGDVEGAAEVEGVADGEVVEGGVLVCAIALVNASALTAAAAMIVLNMYASCGANCERVHRSRRPIVGVLTKQTPEPKSCSHDETGSAFDRVSFRNPSLSLSTVNHGARPVRRSERRARTPA